MSLTCPEYQCPANVDLATLYRLVPINLCRVFLKRLENQMVASSNTEWCPNKDCGCALVVDEDVLAATPRGSCLPVSCSCGLILCFRCLLEQHWPATCRENELYRQARVKHGHETPMFDGSFFGDATPYVAKVKQCPHCNRKMEKGPGCDHMSCSCGKSFCWGCAQDFSTHYKHDPELGYQVWIGCPGEKKDLESVEIGEDLGTYKTWYARAVFYRRYRRVNGWKVQWMKFLRGVKTCQRRVPYKKTRDIVAQYEAMQAIRRSLHRLVREAFDEIVHSLQILEFATVAFYYRRRGGDDKATPSPLAAQLWFFTSRLAALLNEGPKGAEASFVEAELVECLTEIRDAIHAIRQQLP